MNWMSNQLQNATSTIGKTAIGLLGVYLLVTATLAWWWDYEPDTFPVVAHAAARAESRDQQPVTGYVTTATLIHLAETLLEKRGGYLSNDMFPPSSCRVGRSAGLGIRRYTVSPSGSLRLWIA